jgi:hypothetical protein
MANPTFESDWRLFCDRVGEWRERFLSKRTRELSQLLSDGNRTPMERFWAADEEMRQTARDLRDSFGGHSRSRMILALYAMLGCGIIEQEDLNDFSDDLRQRIVINDLK